MFTAKQFTDDFQSLADAQKASIRIRNATGNEDHFYFFNQGHGFSDEASAQIRGWPLENPDMVLITETPATISALKTFGLARGNTPTAVCIAELGNYLRTLVTKSAVSSLSSVTQKKLRFALSAQKKLESLESIELNILPGDTQGQEKLRRDILRILDQLGYENDHESYSFFHSEGRLGKTISSLKDKVEAYQFPVTAFSRQDQISTELNAGEKFFFRLSDHGLTPDKVSTFFRSYYHHQRDAIFPKKENPLKRTFFRILQAVGLKSERIKASQESQDIEKLKKHQKKFKKSLPLRLLLASVKLIVNVPRAVFQGFYNGFKFLPNQWKDFKNSHYNYPPTEAQKKALSDALKKWTEEFKDSPTPTKDNFVTVAPANDHRYLEPDNVFANTIRPIQFFLEENQRTVLDNPTLYAALASTGVIPASALFLPLDFIYLMKSFAGKESALAALLIQSANPASPLSALKHISNVGLAGFTVGMLRSTSIDGYLENLSLTFEDPLNTLDLVLSASLINSNSSNIAYRNSSKLRSAALVESSARQVIPFISKFIASAVRFPLQFIATPSRLIASLFLGKDAIKYEFNLFKNKLFDFCHALLNNGLNLFRFSWKTLNFPFKFLIEVGMRSTAKTIGSASDIILSLGKSLNKAHKKISEYSSILSGLTWPVLRMPGAIMKGIGSIGISVAKLLKRGKNWVRTKWDNYLFRPVDQFFGKIENYLYKNFDSRHPHNQIIERIENINSLISILKIQSPSPNDFDEKLRLLEEFKMALIVYQRNISSGKNGHDNPEISVQFKEDIFKAGKHFSEALKKTSSVKSGSGLKEKLKSVESEFSQSVESGSHPPPPSSHHLNWSQEALERPCHISNQVLDHMTSISGVIPPPKFRKRKRLLPRTPTKR